MAKKMIKIFAGSALLAMLALPMKAQTVLPLDEAVRIAMENNHGIRVAKNNAQVAENNAKAGNAGLLPKIDANGGYNYSNNNTKLTFAGDLPAVSRNGAVSENLSGNVGLTYTLFDGLGNVYTLRKLQAAGQTADIQERLTIENTLLQVTSKYYEVARYQEGLRLTREALAISRDRFERAKTRNDYGGNNSLQLLNAEVDMNADSVDVLNAGRMLDNSRRELNYLMGTSRDSDFNVVTTITTSDYELEEVMRNAKANNANLLLTAHNLLISEWDLKIAKASRYPRLGANAQYGYNRSTSEASIVLENQTIGFSGGLSLNFNLFNGGQTNTRIENAQLAIESNKERMAETVQQIERDVENAYANYVHSQRVIALEARNMETADLNFRRTEEQYNLGQATTTAFREAQLNRFSAQNRLLDAKFSAKLAETELLRLQGKILRGE